MQGWVKALAPVMFPAVRVVEPPFGAAELPTDVGTESVCTGAAAICRCAAAPPAAGSVIRLVAKCVIPAVTTTSAAAAIAGRPHVRRVVTIAHERSQPTSTPSATSHP